MNRKQRYIEKYKNIVKGEDFFVYVIDGESTRILKEEPFDGTWFQISFLDRLKKYADTQEYALSILDYGSGSARHLYEIPDDQVRHPNNFLKEMDGRVQCYWCYDPAIERFNRLPPNGMKFDVVASSEVLEHIPEEHVEATLMEMRSYMKDGGFALFSTGDTKSRLHFNDMENFHITIKPQLEWCRLIHKYFDRFFLDYHEEGVGVFQIEGGSDV